MPELITIEAAEAKYGVPAGTIRGMIQRNQPLDPIGDSLLVYDDDKLARLVSRYMAGKATLAEGSK